MLLRILGAFPLRHERIAKRNKRLPDDADHRVECHPGNNGRFLGRSCFGFPRVVPYRLTQSADQIDFETPALTGTFELASSAKISPSGVDRAVGAMPALENRDEDIAIHPDRSFLKSVASVSSVVEASEKPARRRNSIRTACSGLKLRLQPSPFPLIPHPSTSFPG